MMDQELFTPRLMALVTERDEKRVVPVRKAKPPVLPFPWRGRGMAMLACCPCCRASCTGVHFRDCPLEHRAGTWF